MSTKQFLAVSLLLPLALSSCSSGNVKDKVVAGGEPLYFNREIGFEDVARIKPQVVSECEIEEYLIKGIDEKSARNGLPISSKVSSRVLTVEVVNATPGIFVFGNFGSIPATLDIKFKVTEDGNVIHEQSRRCKTNLAGFLGLQPSACNKIEKCGVNQGHYISERIFRLMYR